MVIAKDEISEVLASYSARRQELIPILQDIQKRWGYLPTEALLEVARFLRVPESTVYGVATFYAQFKLAPQGDHTIKVCLGTACHVRGGTHVLETVERELGIRSGETTRDHKFSLQRVACFGSCALAPVMVVDDHVHGRMSPSKVKDVLDQMR